jgi:hypothetical protein
MYIFKISYFKNHSILKDKSYKNLLIQNYKIINLLKTHLIKLIRLIFSCKIKFIIYIISFSINKEILKNNQIVLKLKEYPKI